MLEKFGEGEQINTEIKFSTDFINYFQNICNFIYLSELGEQILP